MSILLDYLSKKTKTDIGHFLLSQLHNCKYTCHYATHNSKISNTSAALITINDVSSTVDKGYVHTGNSLHETDIAYSGGGRNATIGGILKLRLEDGQTFLEHVLQETSQIKQDLQEIQVDFDLVRKKVLEISTENQLPSTQPELQQVYFPVGGTYHLLTVLPSTSLMFRLNDLEYEKFSHIKNKESYDSFPNSILMKFGGSQTQNAASPMLSRTSGKCLMIPAYPPNIDGHHVSPPRKDFFRRSIYLTPFIRKQFRLLYTKVYRVKNNNVDIRSYRDYLNQNIIDSILFHAAKIQQLPKGWSNKDDFALPPAQRAWLDQGYPSQNIDWQDEIATSIVRWMYWGYNRVNHEEHNTEPYQFSEDLIQKVKEQVLSSLRF